MNQLTDNSDVFGGADGGPYAISEVVDFWGIARRRKYLIILGAVIGLGLGFLAFAQTQPEYESSSQMLIEAKMAPLPVQGDVDAQLRMAARATDHAFVMQSPLLLQKAVDAAGLDQLPAFSSKGDLAKFLAGGLSVRPREKGSGVLNLRFRGTEAAECADALNAIMDSYARFLGENQKEIGVEMLNMITKARDGLRKELTEKEKKYEVFRREAPLLRREGHAMNIHQERQVQIEGARADVLLKKGQLEAKIKGFIDAKDRGVDEDVLLLAAGHESNGPVASRIVTADKRKEEEPDLFPLLLQDRLLAQKFGLNHPKRKSLKRQIDFAQTFFDGKMLEEVDKDLTPVPDSDVEKPDALETYLESLRVQLAAAESEYEHLTDLFESERKSAKELADYQALDNAHQNDIARTQSLFVAVVERLQEVSLLEEHGGNRYNIQIISPAAIGRKVSPNLARNLAIGLALGLCGGFGLGYVVDRGDSTFRSPQDIGQVLQLPLIGQIAELRMANIDVGDSAVSPALCTFHRPTSLDAESFRAIRTALYFSVRGHEHRVIQVTSPMPGDGKSTLAANLAITIAQSGKKVLILDGDFRRPTQHKLFGLSMETGLASVVSDGIDPPQAIQSTGIENLSVMACGPRPSNPSELLSSPRLEELIGVLREQYDFVIFDTPPLLAVTDASIVAARVDGVIFTLRLNKDNRTQGTRARDILREMSANVVGVVVNGVNEKNGTYGYGRGRGYGYGYGYGYSYGHDEADSKDRKQIPSKAIERT